MKHSISFALKLVMGLVLGGSFAVAQSVIIPGAGGVIRVPAPGQIGPFEVDFCGAATAAKRAQHICFGYSRFNSTAGSSSESQSTLKVRAVVFVDEKGAKELYVEQGLPGVELNHPRFAILGPLSAEGKLSQAEMGDVSLTFDANGNVETMTVKTPRHGLATVHR
jgi:hypothetical protein